MAKKRLESRWIYNDTKLPIYYLDILNHRDISDRIAKKLGVIHQSPQLLLVKHGKCIYSASHLSISIKTIKEALETEA